MRGGKAHGRDRQYQVECRNVLMFRNPWLKPWEGDGIDVPFDLPDTRWTTRAGHLILRCVTGLAVSSLPNANGREMLSSKGT
jgi:hypothetical protein